MYPWIICVKPTIKHLKNSENMCVHAHIFYDSIYKALFYVPITHTMDSAIRASDWIWCYCRWKWWRNNGKRGK